MKPRSIEVFAKGERNKVLMVSFQQFDQMTGLPTEPGYVKINIEDQRKVLEELQSRAKRLADFIDAAEIMEFKMYEAPEIVVPDFIIGRGER